MPFIKRSTCSIEVESPHSSRCLPKIHRSPGSVNGELRNRRRFVVIREPDSVLGEQFLDLVEVETRQIEIEFIHLQVGQLERQGFRVPGSLFAGALIRQTIRVNLRGG
jgi:hypothetical protein